MNSLIKLSIGRKLINKFKNNAKHNSIQITRIDSNNLIEK